MSRFVIAAILSGLFALTPSSLSAQTIFTAEVEGKLTRPDTPCRDGAFRCGEALVDGFRPAEWQFFLISFAPVSDSCGQYVAIVTFMLTDTSTLTLSETGTVCGPGKSFFATPPFSWGNPDRATGSWEVLDGTGQFSDVTKGSGTNLSRSAGATLRGTYTGILEE